MNATQTRLNNMTVKTLREIAVRMGFKGISRYRKFELVAFLADMIDGEHFVAANQNRNHDEMITSAHIEAIELNALIDEAYAHKAEDVNMTIPAYLAHRASHNKNGEIFLTGLWSTPIAHMHKVVVMDNGTRFGVSNSDASFFTGEVYDMPAGEIAKCVHCRETVLIPATENNDSEEKGMDAIQAVIKVANDAITALMPSLIASRTVFESVRDSGVASEEMIGYAYQAYTDTYRTIKEYERTIAYAESV